MQKLIKKIFIQGETHCISGLHIGGSDGAMSIGGNDNPIIRNPLDDKPYIPGSSLKGKMRSLLELFYGTIGGKAVNEKGMGKVEFTPTMHPEHRAARLFGNVHKNTDFQRPSRIIVRDGHLLNPDTDFRNMDLPYTELKSETVIDRITSAAMPRPLERVPAGARFNLEIILNIYENENEQELVEDTLLALLLVQDDFLGGSGSRGSGHVRFEIRKENITYKDEAYYLKGQGNPPLYGIEKLTNTQFLLTASKH